MPAPPASRPVIARKVSASAASPASRAGARRSASTRPSCSSTTLSPGSISSKRCVAQSTPTPSSRGQPAHDAHAPRGAPARRARPSPRRAAAAAAGAAAPGRSRPGAAGRRRARATAAAQRSDEPDLRQPPRPPAPAPPARRARAAPRDRRGSARRVRSASSARLWNTTPDLGQRRPGRAAQVVAADLDPARDVVVEPGDQREERGLAGAVDPEQRDELALRHRQRDVVERLQLAEGVADAARRRAPASLDDEGRALGVAGGAADADVVLAGRDGDEGHRRPCPRRRTRSNATPDRPDLEVVDDDLVDPDRAEEAAALDARSPAVPSEMMSIR